ncbi:MAG: hypothetical protein V4638_02230 [Bacteroidota bacterium]
MKKIYSTLLVLFISMSAFAFEGIIHCTKTENGNVTTFDFYIKNNQIAVVSKDADGEYKVLLSADKSNVKICLNSPLYDKKGYYLLDKSEAKKPVPVYRKSETDALNLNGEVCKGYTISTEIGSAIAYFSNVDVDLTGFSAFFEDPIYELIDAFQLKTLPKKMVVSKTTGSYTIDMTAEAQSLDASIFEVPAGFEQFQVTVSE